jgi:hypothetical protein
MGNAYGRRTGRKSYGARTKGIIDNASPHSGDQTVEKLKNIPQSKGVTEKRKKSFFEHETGYFFAESVSNSMR